MYPTYAISLFASPGARWARNSRDRVKWVGGVGVVVLVAHGFAHGEEKAQARERTVHRAAAPPVCKQIGAVRLRIVRRHCCEERREIGIARRLHTQHLFIPPVTCLGSPIVFPPSGIVLRHVIHRREQYTLRDSLAPAPDQPCEEAPDILTVEGDRAHL
jgi:hypothetical protein